MVYFLKLELIGFLGRTGTYFEFKRDMLGWGCWYGFTVRNGVVIGDDWEGKFDFLKEQCEVVYLPRTKEISTTKIKSDLSI